MSKQPSTRIVIADDHPLFRGALRQAVSHAIEGAEVSEVGSLEALTEVLASGGDADLVLLDLTMPGVQGFSGLLFLRADHPEIPVIVVSANDDPAVIRRCIEFGALGFLPKTADVPQMGEAIRAVLDGGVWTPAGVDLSAPVEADVADMVRRLSTLTPQQVRVLMMLSEGLLNKQIAYELGVSEATVKAHVSAILTKLDVDSRTQAVIAASKIAGTAWATTGASATA
ncbi:MAG: response regulator transcription factor [Bosea sp. (in: a-proteobacteria)]|nr:response regulator transcription factor [Bosea sp. (in: a-proteobacteria)]